MFWSDRARTMVEYTSVIESASSTGKRSAVCWWPHNVCSTISHRFLHSGELQLNHIAFWMGLCGL